MTSGLSRRGFPIGAGAAAAAAALPAVASAEPELLPVVCHPEQAKALGQTWYHLYEVLADGRRFIIASVQEGSVDDFIWFFHTPMRVDAIYEIGVGKLHPEARICRSPSSRRSKAPTSPRWDTTPMRKL